MGWKRRNIHHFALGLFLFAPIIALAQTQPDWPGSNVVMRDRGDAGAAGDYELYTIKDGQVLHTEKIGYVSYYGKSRDRLFIVTNQTAKNTIICAYTLPEGKPTGSFVLANIFSGALMQGADDWGVVDKDTAYFASYESVSMGGVFVKANLLNGEFTAVPIPPRRSGASKVRRAGDFILAGSQFATQAFSVPEGKFTKSVPTIQRESVVFIPHDGLYSWNIQGQFTKIADESLDELLGDQRKTQTIVRGVFDVKPLDTPVTDQMVVILSGPSRNGDLRGEPIEPGLTFAKPSRSSIVATVKLPFTPTERIFLTAQENVVAVVNSADGSIVKFDCVTRKEVGRIELPPLGGRVRPGQIQVLY